MVNFVMKKVMIIFLLVVLAEQMNAQDNKSFIDSTNVDSAYCDYEYSASKYNPLKYFGSPFAVHFGEVKYIIGKKEMSYGINYANIPELWGWHIWSAISNKRSWVTAGADYRLSKPWSKYDCSTFGSLGINITNGINPNYKPTFEIGFRIAEGETAGKFNFFSGTMSLITDGQNFYVSIGMSLVIGVLGTSFLLLGGSN